MIWELRDARLTFRALQEACDAVSPTVLNQRLRELRESRLVDLADSEGYGLTLLGRRAPGGLPAPRRVVEALGENTSHDPRELTEGRTVVKEHVTRTVVEWAHCDAAGIVFYPYFYTWFDQGTERLFRANRLSYAELRRDFGVAGMPLLETGARYANACKLGDELVMRTWVDESGRAHLPRQDAIVHADGRPALEGFERRVWAVPDPAAPKGLRAIPIPEEAIARLRGLRPDGPRSPVDRRAASAVEFRLRGPVGRRHRFRRAHPWRSPRAGRRAW